MNWFARQRQEWIAETLRVFGYDLPDVDPPRPFADYVREQKATRGAEPTEVSSWSWGPISRTRFFETASNAELRALLASDGLISAKLTRRQLLALCKNRWPCGYWIEMEGEG